MGLLAVRKPQPFRHACHLFMDYVNDSLANHNGCTIRATTKPKQRAHFSFTLYISFSTSSLLFLSFLCHFFPFHSIFAARALEAERIFAAPYPASHTCDICNEEAHPISHRYNMLKKHILFAWRQENH